MFIRPHKPTPEPYTRHSLRDLGYQIDPDDGQVRNISTDELFAFTEDPARKKANIELYNSLVHPASRAVLDIMTDTLHMEPIAVPNAGQPHCFIYATPGALSGDKLVVLVVGNGTFGGVWAWNILLKQGIHHGSVIDYVRDCEQRGLSVLVLNPNMNIVAPDGVAESYNSYVGRGTEIKGSETADEHVGYVWSHMLRDSPVRSIAFVTYSTSGSAVIDLLKYDYERFVEKTACVAFIDSTHSLFDLGSGSIAWLELGARHWETSVSGNSTSVDRVGCPVVAVDNTTESREMTPSLCRNGVVEYVTKCIERGPVPDAIEFGDGQNNAANLAQLIDDLSGSDGDGADGIPDRLSNVTMNQTFEVKEDGYIGWD
ncbi:hypothetical protein GGH12_003924 [Coemansia sp. RSA 1822]|nr:hypothetical protein LPJ76_001280 [Coemansia sp. RSA 638]KAJ2542889.1 hypothetical protein GGF49_002522 [Coemansia sp. RSA 1853]KAJ2561549.1 hypothetical protein GGH12_003924 [Coemansia sp. RSA 1822]